MFALLDVSMACDILHHKRQLIWWSTSFWVLGQSLE